jgi:hypothetical protein
LYVECCQLEDAKRALFLYGNDTSKTVKEVLTDLHKIKGVSCSAAGQSGQPGLPVDVKATARECQ